MKRVLAIIFCTAASFSWAQDIHFTQTQEVPMLINPAATGMFNGWERVSVNHKNQWVNSRQFLSGASNFGALSRKKTRLSSAAAKLAVKPYER